MPKFAVDAQHSLPVISFAPFLQDSAGSGTGRRRVAERIGKACRDTGFFYLIDHGVDHSLIEAAFTQSQRFFALPQAEKEAISVSRSICHRGYFALGDENLDPAKQRESGDFKEGLKIGRDLPADHPLVAAGVPLHGPNQWPQNLPGWRETMQAYYAALEQLGFQLMRALALALALPEDFFADKLDLPMATLGPLHYPPLASDRLHRRLSAGAHSDYGCLTLLAQDDSGGLQVKSRAGWLEAPPLADSFVVNIGDMMERWSNGQFASTLHRVVNRSPRDRYSIAFFYDPDYDAEVACLETCCGPGNPPRYPPTTGLQHLLERIDASFAYRQRA